MCLQKQDVNASNYYKASIASTHFQDNVYKDDRWLHEKYLRTFAQHDYSLVNPVNQHAADDHYCCSSKLLWARAKV